MGKLTIFNVVTHRSIIKSEKVGGANDMSRWRNRPVPPLADNPVFFYNIIYSVFDACMYFVSRQIFN